MTRALASAQLLTLGASLTGPESALSSLPACPVFELPPQNPFSRPYRSACGGHLFESGPPPVGSCLECGVDAMAWQSLVTCTGRPPPAEHEQARDALAAAERRAPHVQAERARTRERLRAEVERAEKGGLK